MYEDCRSGWERDYRLRWSRSSTRAFVHTQAIDLFIICKVKTGTAMAGPAVVAPTALLCDRECQLTIFDH